MSLVALILGFCVMIAVSIDLSAQQDDDSSPDDETEEEPFDPILGTSGADLIVSLAEPDGISDTANPYMLETQQSNPRVIKAGAGNDTLVGRDGDELRGEEGDDIFIVHFEPRMNESAPQIPDFAPETEIALIRLGGAATNAFSDDPEFDLSNRITLEHDSDHTHILVDNERVLEIPRNLNLSVKWSLNEPNLNKRFEHLNELRNVDGSRFTGSYNEVDVLIMKVPRYLS